MTSNGGPPPSLPGLAWDPAKGRYFQIQKSGTEDSARSEYSLRSIRLRKVERDAEEQRDKRRRLANVESVKRSPFLQQVAGLLHRREFEHQASAALKQHVLANFQRIDASQVTVPRLSHGEDGSETGQLVGTASQLHDFIYDEAHEKLYFIKENHLPYTLYCMEHSTTPKSSVSKTISNPKSHWKVSELFTIPYYQPIRSPNIHYTGKQVSIACGTGLYDLMKSPPGDWPVCETRFTPAPSYIQTCAQNPFTSNPNDWILVTGGRGKVYARSSVSGYTIGGMSPLDEDRNRYWDLIYEGHKKSRIHALEWIQPNVFAFNDRDTLQLFDRRRGQKSGAVVNKFKHLSMPFQIARADASGNTLIVTGMNSCMSLYDIRYVNKLKSQSVLSFEWSNELDERLGLDVSLDFSIVAASQDNHSIGIYCSKTGRTLQTLRGESDPFRKSTYRQFGKIQILEKQRTAVRLISNYGGELLEFGLE